MSEEKMIYKKMLDIQSDIDAIKKTKEMKTASGGVQYKFRGIEDVLDEVAPILRKHKVFVTPITHKVTYQKERVSKYNASGAVIGERFDTACFLEMKYRFQAEDGSVHEVGPVCGEGLDTGDKSSSKANSVCYKLAMIATFSIPVNDMPDIEDPKTDSRDGVVIENENYEVKGGLIKTITEKCGLLTKGMNKDQKADFIVNKLGVKAFNEINNMKNKDLQALLSKLTLMEVEF